MKPYPRFVIPALIAASSVIAISAHAREIDLSEIVVTPNRTPTEKSKVGSTVNIVSQEEIKQQSLPLVVDYLNLIPGISYSSPGGIGQEGSLTIRGADKKYIKTLFNGIDISDPTSTQVQTSYQHLLIGGVEHIEVLKGPQSTLYGSDAVAGVVAISTLGDVDPGFHHSVSLEGGSHGTILGGYDLTGASDTGKFAASFYGLHTDGISAADESNGNIELDAYENYTATFAGEQMLNDRLSVFASGLWIKAHNDLDAYSGIDPRFPVVDDPNSFGRSEQLAGRAGFNLDLLDGRFSNTFSIQASKIDKLSHTESTAAHSGYDDVSDAYFSGNRVKVEYQGTYRATDTLTFLGGADYDWQTAENSTESTFFGPSSLSGTVWNTGMWGEAIWTPIEALTVTGGLRYDNHEFFGGHITWRATAAYLFEDTGTKIRGSVATGFRAPSIYELYSPPPFAGNLELEPETSFGWDVGIDQKFLDGRLNASITYFNLDVDNLIDFIITDFTTFTGHYAQVPGTTRRHGIEAAIDFEATSWLSLGAAYTYTSSVDATGERRPRVPRHRIALSADYRPAEKWTVSVLGTAAIDTLDGFPPTELKDYFLLDAKVAYKPTDSTELYVRGENLLNQNYQVAKGFGQPGIGVFAGFKAQF